VIKDFQVELRTRYAFSTLLMFALVTLLTLGISFAGARLDPLLHSALIWILIYFAALQGLSLGFVREEEAKTAMNLRIYAQSMTVFFGKFAFSCLLLMFLTVLLLPLYYILMRLELQETGLFILIAFLGVVGMSAVTTLISAIVSRANVRGALFAVLSFPLVLPLLVVAISATSICLGGPERISLSDSLRIMIGYPVIVLAVSSLLFEYIWNG
jgi:heme exporter protein B